MCSVLIVRGDISVAKGSRPSMAEERARAKAELLASRRSSSIRSVACGVIRSFGRFHPAAVSPILPPWPILPESPEIQRGRRAPRRRSRRSSRSRRISCSSSIRRSRPGSARRRRRPMTPLRSTASTRRTSRNTGSARAFSGATSGSAAQNIGGVEAPPTALRNCCALATRTFATKSPGRRIGPSGRRSPKAA